MNEIEEQYAIYLAKGVVVDKDGFPLGSKDAHVLGGGRPSRGGVASSSSKKTAAAAAAESRRKKNANGLTQGHVLGGKKRAVPKDPREAARIAAERRFLDSKFCLPCSEVIEILADSSDEGIDDDDIWDKALAKHNEEEQERFVDQFETLYTDDVISPLKMEELERTKSERVKDQSRYQAAAHKYSSRHDQSQAEEEEETHDDLIAWSDDKLDWSDDDVITDLPRGRSDSISPKKSQLWHKKDAHDDSSISFEGYD